MRPSRSAASRCCPSSAVFASRVRAGAGLRPLLFAFLFLLADAGLAAEPAQPAEIGLWQTISDKTGKPQGYIRIQLVGDELRGVIEKGMPGDDPNEICTKCRGERKNQKKIGMTIITGMHRQDDHWGGGEILDPDSGTLYRCKIRAVDSGGKLEVRGFIGISLLGRTQTWLRAE